jgi:hypothetical protein
VPIEALTWFTNSVCTLNAMSTSLLYEIALQGSMSALLYWIAVKFHPPSYLIV